MKHKRNIALMILMSITLTIMGYIIDYDPLYSNLLSNVIEFIAISTVLTMFFIGVYGVTSVVRQSFIHTTKAHK